MNPRPAAAALCAWALVGSSACYINFSEGSSWKEPHGYRARDTVQGSGVFAEETRELEPFDAITVSDRIDLELTLGPERAVAVRGDDNVVPEVVTEVRGTTLHVSMRRGRSYDSRRRTEVDVRVEALSAVTLAGANEARLSGLAGEAFRAVLSGSAHLVASGEVGALEAVLSGSGQMDLGRLSAREATIEISGSGGVLTRARERLDVSISGSGEVQYLGEPAIETHVSGSGAVTRARTRGPKADR